MMYTDSIECGIVVILQYKVGNQLISGVNDNAEEIVLNPKEVNLLKQCKCIVWRIG